MSRDLHKPLGYLSENVLLLNRQQQLICIKAAAEMTKLQVIFAYKNVIAKAAEN